jgi:hypothetical protein
MCRRCGCEDVVDENGKGMDVLGWTSILLLGFRARSLQSGHPL